MAATFRSHNLRNAAGILKGAMAKSLKRGGKILQQEMQRLAPVWTGRMQRSVRVTNPTFRDDAWRVLVGPTVDYAKYTEEEPWIIGKRPGPKSRAKGAEIPWMKPAAKAVRGEVVAELRNGISVTVRELQRTYKP